MGGDALSAHTPVPDVGLLVIERTDGSVEAHTLQPKRTLSPEELSDHSRTVAAAQARERLNAAAPDLLAACEKANGLLTHLMKVVPWGKTFDLDVAALNEALLVLPAAITKARGQ